jgi:hypothetical protein
MFVTPAVLYLFLGLQDVQWAVGNSRGARKLTRTPHVNKKKKKRDCIQLIVLSFGIVNVLHQRVIIQGFKRSLLGAA